MKNEGQPIRDFVPWNSQNILVGSFWHWNMGGTAKKTHHVVSSCINVNNAPENRRSKKDSQCVVIYPMDRLDEYVQKMHSLKYFIGSFVRKGHFSHFSSWENHFPVAKIIDVVLAVEYAKLKLEDVVAFVDGNIEKSVGDRLVTADSLTTTSQVRYQLVDNIRSSFKTEQQFAICFAKTLWLAWCVVCF